MAPNCFAGACASLLVLTACGSNVVYQGDGNEGGQGGTGGTGAAAPDTGAGADPDPGPGPDPSAGAGGSSDDTGGVGGYSSGSVMPGEDCTTDGYFTGESPTGPVCGAQGSCFGIPLSEQCSYVPGRPGPGDFPTVYCDCFASSDYTDHFGSCQRKELVCEELNDGCCKYLLLDGGG